MRSSCVGYASTTRSLGTGAPLVCWTLASTCTDPSRVCCPAAGSDELRGGLALFPQCAMAIQLTSGAGGLAAVANGDGERISRVGGACVMVQLFLSLWLAGRGDGRRIPRVDELVTNAFRELSTWARTLRWGVGIGNPAIGAHCLLKSVHPAFCVLNNRLCPPFGVCRGHRSRSASGRSFGRSKSYR